MSTCYIMNTCLNFNLFPSISDQYYDYFVLFKYGINSNLFLTKQN